MFDDVCNEGDRGAFLFLFGAKAARAGSEERGHEAFIEGEEIACAKRTQRRCERGREEKKKQMKDL